MAVVLGKEVVPASARGRIDFFIFMYSLLSTTSSKISVKGIVLVTYENL
jgi:hypothetical protein